MILLIDNYDSFVYILKQYFELSEQEVVVRRNDEITIQEAELLKPDFLVISPGPATPKESGVSMDMIKHFAGKIPILGVCLGHQCMGELFGGKVIRNPLGVRHGKRSPIIHEGKGVFAGMPMPFMATRYHSLVIEQETFPHKELEITAWTKEGEIMGVRHKKYAIEGVQFHPESYMTESGMQLIKNFLNKNTKQYLVNYNFAELIKKISIGNDLTSEESRFVAQQIMEGKPSPVQVATLLATLSQKGETAQEIAGFASVMREKVTRITAPKNKIIIDTCGTGGDNRHTFNVSTLSAIVAASAGAIVAKHGNRSVSSPSGSADILEKLGVNILTDAPRTSQILADVGIAFLFAQKLHTAMRNVGPVRKEMGVRTIFNILGPLTNPANADKQVIGVFSKKYLGLMAEALRTMGCKEALVFHSEDGLDEISVSDKTFFAHLKNGQISEGIIDAKEIIGKTFPLEDIKGGSAQDNANIAIELLNNRLEGAIKEIVLINAASAVWLSELAGNLKDAYILAKSALESGKALEKLNELVSASNAI